MRKYQSRKRVVRIQCRDNDETFGSLQVTLGMLTGKAFGGDSQVFVKPGVLFGGDAPADWSIQVGYKVLNF